MAVVYMPAGAKLFEAIAGEGTNLDRGNEFKLGDRICLDEGGEAVYVHAAEAITLGYYVSYDEAFEASLITTANADTGIGIGCAADVAAADNDFIWARVQGNFAGATLDLCAADVPLYTSATPGVLDDDSTAQTLVEGVVSKVTNSTGGISVAAAMSPNGMNAI